jgi:4-hydroxybenzoate polyprenyltransferase
MQKGTSEMPDIRVLKKMALWLSYVVVPITLLMSALWIGHEVFDANPDTVVNWILALFCVYIFYQIAKIQVDMERRQEQRLADKIRDIKE